MLIELRAEQAEREIVEGYPSASKPLTKTTSVLSPHDINSWRSNPREERRADTSRKFAAVRFYLWLANETVEALPASSFPAVFDFVDGERRYPDKGVIKSLLEANLIVGQLFRDELVFVLTEAGQALFQGATRH